MSKINTDNDFMPAKLNDIINEVKTIIENPSFQPNDNQNNFLGNQTILNTDAHILGSIMAEYAQISNPTDKQKLEFQNNFMQRASIIDRNAEPNDLKQAFEGLNSNPINYQGKVAVLPMQQLEETINSTPAQATLPTAVQLEQYSISSEFGNAPRYINDLQNNIKNNAVQEQSTHTGIMGVLFGKTTTYVVDNQEGKGHAVVSVKQPGLLNAFFAGNKPSVLMTGSKALLDSFKNSLGLETVPVQQINAVPQKQQESQTLTDPHVQQVAQSVKTALSHNQPSPTGTIVHASGKVEGKDQGRF